MTAKTMPPRLPDAPVTPDTMPVEREYVSPMLKFTRERSIVMSEEFLTISERMHVRDEREVGAVAALEEEGHAGDEAEHGGRMARVGEADGDEEATRDDSVRVQEHLLAPDAGTGIDEVGDDAAERAEDDVEEAEHGGPVAGPGLAEGGEVLDVVGAQDGVDGQFGAKGAEVAAREDEGLQGEDDVHGFAEGRFDHDLAPGGVQHLLLADLRFVVEGTVALVGRRELQLLVVAGCRRAFGAGCGCPLAGDLARDVHHISRDAVARQVLLGVQVTFAPFAHGRVGTEQEHGDGGSGDADERHDEGNAPCHVRRQMLSPHQGVEDGGHQEVGDTTACIAQSSGKRIGRAHDVLVEESRRPDLARHETTT